MTQRQALISRWEYEVLKAMRDFPSTEYSQKLTSFGPGIGWLNNVDVRETLKSGSLETRSALDRLASAGLVFIRTLHSARHYKISPTGERFLENPEFDDGVNSAAWTGVVTPVQVAQCLTIVSEMEDVCERMTNNFDRAQIFGLVRALEVLLTIPEPPRAGVVTLLRDPAFSNIVQVATFLAALIAAVKP